MYLFFDTETTGLPNRSRSSDWEGQPHLVQLGALLVDPTGYTRGEINLIVRPVGWFIPREASELHGITTGTAQRYGLPRDVVIDTFNHMMESAEILVAHNLDFDLFMLEIELGRLEYAALSHPAKRYCTMEGARPILKLPATQRMRRSGHWGYKTPNLQEAYGYFFGKDFDGAHDAMADVRACRDIYFALQRWNQADPDQDQAARETQPLEELNP